MPKYERQNEKTFWGTLRRVASLPKAKVVAMGIWVVGVAITAIAIGDQFGAVYGLILGVFIGPLVLARMMRAGLGDAHGRHQRTDQD